MSNKVKGLLTFCKTLTFPLKNNWQHFTKKGARKSLVITKDQLNQKLSANLRSSNK